MAAKPSLINLPIAASSSGDNTLLAAVASRRIIVHQLVFVCAAAVVVRFESAAGGTALTGQMSFEQGGGMVLPYNEKGWFETTAGQLLNLELGGAVSVAGVLKYSLAP